MRWLLDPGVLNKHRSRPLENVFGVRSQFVICTCLCVNTIEVAYLNLFRSYSGYKLVVAIAQKKEDNLN